MRHELSDRYELPRPFVEDASTHLRPSPSEMQAHFKTNANHGLQTEVSFLDMGDNSKLYGEGGSSRPASELAAVQPLTEQSGGHHKRAALEAAFDFGKALGNRAIGFLSSSSQQGAYIQERAQFIGNVGHSVDQVIDNGAASAINGAARFIANPREATDAAMQHGVKVVVATEEKIAAIVHDPVKEVTNGVKNVIESLHVLGTMNQSQVADLTGKAIVAKVLANVGAEAGAVGEATAVEAADGAYGFARSVAKTASAEGELGVSEAGTMKKTMEEIKETAHHAWEELHKGEISHPVAAASAYDATNSALGVATESHLPKAIADWAVERIGKDGGKVKLGQENIMVYYPGKDKDLVHLL